MAQGVSDGLLLFDVVDRVLDDADLLDDGLGNVDVERLLESQHKLDRVEAVGSEVVDEGGLGNDPPLLDT